MLSFNIATRLVKIDGPKQGTGFVIDKDNFLFVVTAKHVVDDVPVGSTLPVAFRHWRGPIAIHGKRSYGDVTALLINANNIFEPFKCVFHKGGLMFAQDMYLIGFPFGWAHTVDFGDGPEINPFVKKAIFSNVGDGDTFYLDTRVNPGFSGAPVFFLSSK